MGSTEAVGSGLQVSNVSKRFGKLVALNPLDVDFLPGQIHAVVGENGAGKSTLMNLIAGFHKPDSGRIILDGNDIPYGSPRLCRAAGIELVHQHFMLVPEFSLRQNLQLSLLGLGQSSFAQIEKTAADFGWSFDWDQKVSEVSVGVQQRIEILKATLGDPKVVVFDEPTAVLSKPEIDELFGLMQRLKAMGKIVVLIAHKVNEVLSIADQITVLRRGKHIVTTRNQDVSPDQLVEWLVGERLVEDPKQLPSQLEIGLEVTGPLEFHVRRGEILGIGGVDGNGQLELSEALAGVTQFEGSLKWRGQTLQFNKLRVGFVPQDRRVDGLALNMSIEENMRIAKLGVRLPKNHASILIDKFSIKAESKEDKAMQLSGGNQQKVILARVIDAEPELLIVVNPTRGLDVKAAQFVHQSIKSTAQNGAAVVLFSTDPDELNQLSDRKVYMSRHRLYPTEAEALLS
jgi:general nucleoside transport system ATP-binding protein